MQRIIFLYGLSGAGKNFIGEALARQNNFYFYDGDDLLTPPMKKQLHQNKIFTQPMRDEFVAQLILKLNNLLKTHTKIIIAQGLYKKSNRQQLKTAFPEAHFIEVKANDKNIEQRLRQKNLHHYAQLIKNEFESGDDKVIENNTTLAAALDQVSISIEFHTEFLV